MRAGKNAFSKRRNVSGLIIPSLSSILDSYCIELPFNLIPSFLALVAVFSHQLSDNIPFTNPRRPLDLYPAIKK
ncbi:hypothetical protein A7Q09_00080 [Methylacidiphilum sp. Yel]|nr:hypothetical protein A7Q09_00080 [Methylacidiphilum sp. Yel]